MEKRTKIIMFRVTLVEKRLIELKAKKSKQQVAVYCRNIVLHKQDNRIFNEKELQAFEVLHEYRVNFVRIKNLLKNKDSAFASEVMKTAKFIENTLKIFTHGRQS